MEKKACITVIVPVYNGESYLSAAFESLEKQTIFDKLHIIFVDDGSTDQSYLLCQEFYHAYPKKVTLMKNDRNRGVSYTRNQALSKVDTEYVTFFDCDDRLHPKIYEHMLELMQTFKSDIVCVNHAIQKGVHLKYHREEKIECYTKDEVFMNLVLSKHITNSNCDKLYRTDTCAHLRFDEKISIGEDMLFNFDAIANSSKIICDLGELYYYYVQHNSSAMNAPFTNRFFDTIKVLEEVKERYASSKKIMNILDCRIAYEKAKLIEKMLLSHVNEYESVRKQYLKDIRKIPFLTLITLISNFSVGQIAAVLSTIISPYFYIRLMKLKRRIKNE